MVYPKPHGRDRTGFKSQFADSKAHSHKGSYAELPKLRNKADRKISENSSVSRNLPKIVQSVNPQRNYFNFSITV